MTIVSCNEIDPTSYDEFIATVDGASIYHTFGWRRMLSLTYGFADGSLALTSGGRINAILPLMRRPRTRGPWVSLPFSHRVPLLAASSNDADAIIAGAIARLGALIVRDDTTPVASGRNIASGSVDAALDLSDGYERVASRFSSMARRALRKALRANLEIGPEDTDSGYAAFLDLMIETRRRQGAPMYPTTLFEYLRQTLPEGSHRLWVARSRNRPIAAILIAEFRQRALYAYGASTSDREAMKMRPNNLLFDRVINDLCNRGVTRLDLGSAPLANPGLISFKKSLGATIVPIGYQVWPEDVRYRPVDRSSLKVRAASALLSRLPKRPYLRLSHWITGRLG